MVSFVYAAFVRSLEYPKNWSLEKSKQSVFLSDWELA